MRAPGSSGQLAAQPLDRRRLRLDGHEVGLREVAVVVRLLLRAVRRQAVVVRLVVVRVLLDRGALLVERDLVAHRRARCRGR